MRVLLDTTVLLDAILQRPHWHQEADATLQAGALERPRSRAQVSWRVCPAD